MSQSATVKKIVQKIRSEKDTLLKQYNVKSLYIFGSVARGSATRKSDIDFLVEFSSNEVGLFEFVRLKFFLESLLKRKVDLVTRDALKDWMASEVEKESIRVA